VTKFNKNHFKAKEIAMVAAADLRISGQFLCLFMLFTVFAVFNAKASEAPTVSTLDAVEQIQKTLIFSDKSQPKEQRSSEVIESKSSFNSKGALQIERSASEDEDAIDLEILVIDPEENAADDHKQKLAYNAVIAGQFEVAVELYKQIIRKDPQNHYAKFGLASTYHKLNQFKQAKGLYYQLLKVEWDDAATKDQVVGNLIAVIVEEAPNEAVYLLSKLSGQNPESAYILAGAAMAYDKINKSDQAALLLKKAIRIDPQTPAYQFNLAIIYDKMGEYDNALKLYSAVLQNYVSGTDVTAQIPLLQIRQRIQFIKNQT
jgi:lipopolysaccharide assembly protein B